MSGKKFRAYDNATGQASTLAVFVILFAGPVTAQSASSLSEEVRQYVAVDAPVFALTNVTLIDGTGGPARVDQVIVIADGAIQAVGGAGEVRVPAGAEVLDFRGHTVIPGLVGLHNHMYFNVGGGEYVTMPYSYPRLYLAAGMTTTRSTGAMNPYKEINLKRAIDEGEVPGPKMHITGPYLQGSGLGPKLHPLTGPEDARRMVAYWADEGVTWFKAYTQISREELGAAIDEAHKRGIKVTAHLCSVGFREAVALGIDNLEHGLTVNTEYYGGKRADECPIRSRVDMYADLDISSAPVRRTIRDLVEHGVAITSTLVTSERGLRTPPLEQRDLDVLAPEAREGYLERREQRLANRDPRMGDVLRSAMEFERAFVQAGGFSLQGLMRPAVEFRDLRISGRSSSWWRRGSLSRRRSKSCRRTVRASLECSTRPARSRPGSGPIWRSSGAISPGTLRTSGMSCLSSRTGSAMTPPSCWSRCAEWWASGEPGSGEPQATARLKGSMLPPDRRRGKRWRQCR